MTSRKRMRIATVIGVAATMGMSLVGLTGLAASADVPETPAMAEFTAPECAGETMFDPTANDGYAVADLTLMFGDRLTSYNDGRVVPLYDSYGGSILLTDQGANTGEAAYPPICGTRYVSSVGAAVSEWMFCTDRAAQTCGDTNADGSLVDHDGNPINPMTGLPTNAKLTADQEKLIAYLVQNGHSYDGIGNQAWDGATQARSDLDTNARNALQTLVWCVSDPATDGSDFAETCALNMDADEQARVLAMIPDEPELAIMLGGSTPVDVGDTATFRLSTNMFNQPISLQLAGAVLADLRVCGGTATLSGTTLTVSGADPSTSTEITLCADAVEAGTATLDAAATPPSTSHIGWSQSINAGLVPACQVYATFHEDEQATVTARAQIVVRAVSTPEPSDTDTPSPEPSDTDTPTPEPSETEPTPTQSTPAPVQATPSQGDLAVTGGTANLGAVGVGAALLIVGATAVVVGARRSRQRS